MIKNYGQAAIILIMVLLLFLQKNGKIPESALLSSVYVDTRINESNQIIKNRISVLSDSLIKCESIDENIKEEIRKIHQLVDSISEQIKHLKDLAVEISGGLEVQENYYSINNPGYKFGHSNELTGDKGKDNGEGSKLKHKLEKLRLLEKALVDENDSSIQQSIEQLLDTSEKKMEEDSDYIWSWEEQNFKLIPTVGIINLLSVIEGNVYNSELLSLIHIRG